MPYRLTPFVNQNYYHIFNRGVEKRKIFLNDRDYQRFLQTLHYYQFSGPKPRFSTHKVFKSKDFYKNPKIIEIVCYCLMPNHYHLLIRQLKEKGVQEFANKISNSYTKYFNTKNNRVGPLFQGAFKAVAIETDEQLIHLSRYIHLNPYVSELTKDLETFPYSSYKDFLKGVRNELCNPEFILKFFKNSKDYKEFIKDQEAYALEIERIKHLLIDVD